MNITFLGTAAANAYPEAFCQCANCERARALGGASLRRQRVGQDPGGLGSVGEVVSARRQPQRAAQGGYGLGGVTLA